MMMSRTSSVNPLARKRVNGDLDDPEESSEAVGDDSDSDDEERVVVMMNEGQQYPSSAASPAASGEQRLSAELYGHTCIVDFERAQLIYFGGCNRLGRFEDQTRVFQADSRRWLQPRRTPGVQGRCFHTAVLYKTYMYLYGGTSNGIFADLHRCHLPSGTWSQVLPNAAPHTHLQPPQAQPPPTSASSSSSSAFTLPPLPSSTLTLANGATSSTIDGPSLLDPLQPPPSVISPQSTSPSSSPPPPQKSSRTPRSSPRISSSSSSRAVSPPPPIRLSTSPPLPTAQATSTSAHPAIVPLLSLTGSPAPSSGLVGQSALSDADDRQATTIETVVSTTSLGSGGTVPAGRYGHTAVVHESTMYVFGGYTTDGIACNDLWAFDLENNVWQKLRPRAEGRSVVPADVYHHSAVVYQGSMYVFGGYRCKANVLLEYRFSTGTWSLVQTRGKGPPARYGHSAVRYRHYMYIFGGRDIVSDFDDAFVFNFKKLQWRQLRIRNGSRRFFASAIMYDSTLFIHGGQNIHNFPLDDLISASLLHVLSNQKSDASASTAIPPISSSMGSSIIASPHRSLPPQAPSASLRPRTSSASSMPTQPTLHGGQQALIVSPPGQHDAFAPAQLESHAGNDQDTSPNGQSIFITVDSGEPRDAGVPAELRWAPPPSLSTAQENNPGNVALASSASLTSTGGESSLIAVLPKKEKTSHFRSQFRQTLEQDFGRMSTRGQLADLEIIVEEPVICDACRYRGHQGPGCGDCSTAAQSNRKTIMAHRNVLFCRCPPFRAMLRSGMQEALSGQVVIRGVEFAAFTCMLDYIYTGTLSTQTDDALELMAIIHAAEQYQLPHLKRLCEKRLVRNVCPSNVSTLLSFARQFTLHQLLDICLTLDDPLELKLSASRTPRSESSEFDSPF